MPQNTDKRNEYLKIVAKAQADEEFKKRLLDVPATVLKEYGIEIPEGMTVKIVEQKENEIHFILPVKPSKTHELTDDDLETVAAAGSLSGGMCPALL